MLEFYPSIVWIEPVRDWNPKGGALAACELNLWGIETFEFVKVIRANNSVNWTCEGLKRNSEILTLNLLECVNWTCEGLKLNNINHKINNFLSVNWTCEGLKQVFKDKVNHDFNMCELNLWGIETNVL